MNFSLFLTSDETFSEVEIYSYVLKREGGFLLPRKARSLNNS